MTRTLATILRGCIAILCVVSTFALADDRPPVVAVVVGAAGQPEYGEQFHTWADRVQKAAEAAGASYVEIGRQEERERTDRERLEEFLAAQQGESESPLWLILIGHGTSFRDTANFNLRGPDVSSKELAGMLEGVRRPLVVVNCASASGPFIRDLAGPGRIIVTATQSGAEQNYARFGDYFSQALSDPAADLDHDEQVSLLEAFLSASGRVAQFYQEQARLATEHALLEDNGDGLGTPATFFRGVRAMRAARDDAPLDGSLAARTVLVPGGVDRSFTAEQLDRRAELEEAIDHLRNVKATMPEVVYYAELEALLVDLAQLYDEVESASRDGAPPEP